MLTSKPPRSSLPKQCTTHCLARLGTGVTWLQVLLNEKAQEVASRQYKLLSSGRTISADKVYVCVGGKPNTAFLQLGPSRSILDQRGYVKVSTVHGFGNLHDAVENAKLAPDFDVTCIITHP